MTAGTITFVPSVHFSPTHRRRVHETIRAEDPDLVAVELDERRFERLTRDTRPTRAELARELPPATAAAYTALRTVQRTVVQFYGLDPSKTDMETAIETAAQLDVDVALIDEPLAETVSELTARVGWETLPEMFLRMQRMGPRAAADQLELLTLSFREIEDGDDVQPAIDQLRHLLPDVAEVLIDQRDRTMARRLEVLRREGHDVVVVIGAGHHNGILDALDDLRSRDTDPEIGVPIRSPMPERVNIPIE
jgi:pheromone shutdown protein TraB